MDKEKRKILNTMLKFFEEKGYKKEEIEEIEELDIIQKLKKEKKLANRFEFKTNYCKYVDDMNDDKWVILKNL